MGLEPTGRSGPQRCSVLFSEESGCLEGSGKGGLFVPFLLIHQLVGDREYFIDRARSLGGAVGHADAYRKSVGPL